MDRSGNFRIEAAFVGVEGTSAVVKVSTAEGDEEQTYRLVDNRWLPSKLADGWDEEIVKAKTQLKSLQTPQGKQSLAHERQMISMGSAKHLRGSFMVESAEELTVPGNRTLSRFG